METNSDTPYLSWDGSKIYYFGYPDNDPVGGEIYSMGANGSNRTRLSFNVRNFDPFNNGTNRRSAVSPDGTKFLYECDGLPTTNSGRICVGSVSGYAGNSNPRITPNSYSAIRASYSPDGIKIVFEGSSYPCNSYTCTARNIYVMDLTNSTIAQLTFEVNPSQTSSLRSVNARFSPDGTKIVFESNRGNPSSAGSSGNPYRPDIWVMDANGSNQTSLTTS